jgi:hypothetical protein
MVLAYSELHCRHIDRQCPTSSSGVCSCPPSSQWTSRNVVTAKRLKQIIVDICKRQNVTYCINKTKSEIELRKKCSKNIQQFAKQLIIV